MRKFYTRNIYFPKHGFYKSKIWHTVITTSELNIFNLSLLWYIIPLIWEANFHFWLRWNKRDWVYPAPEKQLKNKRTEKIWRNNNLQILHIRHHRTEIFERRDTNEMGPIIAPTYCLKSDSRTLCRQREPEQSTEVCQSGGNRAWRPMWQEFTEWSIKKKRAAETEHSRDQKILNLQLSTFSACMYKTRNRNTQDDQS